MHQVLDLLKRKPDRKDLACLAAMSAQCIDREDCTVEPGVEIEERLLELIRRMGWLELNLGDEALGTARRQLRELDATSAMGVLKLLDQAAKRWSISTDPVAESPNHGAVRVVAIMLRDSVLMFVVNRGGAEPAGDNTFSWTPRRASLERPWIGSPERNSCWLTISSGSITDAFLVWRGGRRRPNGW